MNELKAITTVYKGYRFRSRLEARWAVFFDAQGIEWEFERDGFELPSGRYLPDFWLPHVRMWAEVKPVKLTAAEQRLAGELLVATGHRVMELIGPPDCKPYHAWEIDYDGQPALQGFVIDGRWGRYYRDEHRFYSIDDDESSSEWCEICMRDAVNAARSARFEHGESPG